MIPYEEILQATARGWCTPKNENKIMDPDLAEAIAIEVFTLSSNHEPYIPESEVVVSES